MKKTFKFLLSFVLLLSISGGITQVEASSKTKTFKNCKELNEVYKNGVTNKEGTKNKVVSKVKDKKTNKVTSKTVYKASKATLDTNVYKLHIKMDNDKDGIACEK